MKPGSAKELKVTRFKQDSVSLKDRQYTEQAWLPREAVAQCGESLSFSREKMIRTKLSLLLLSGIFFKKL